MIDRDFGILKGMVLDIERDAHRAFKLFDVEACRLVAQRMDEIREQAAMVAQRAGEAREAALAARHSQYRGLEGAPPADPSPGRKKRPKGA